LLHGSSSKRVRWAPASFFQQLLFLGCSILSTHSAAFSPPAMPGIARAVTTSDRVALNVIDTGVPKIPTAQTLVFVPGWTMPARLFHAQVSTFSASHRVVAIDPRGQGESEVPQTGYTLDRRAQDIAEVLTALDLTNVVLIGWSLGVLESLHVANSSASSRIAAYVLIDNSVGEATPPKGDPNFFPNLRSQRHATVEKFVRGMFKSTPSSAFIAFITEQAQRASVENSIALLSYPKPREYWRDSLYAISKPVAYFVTPRFFAQADAVAAKRTGAFIKKFPNAGHALFVDEPQAFNAALSEFLGTVK
jgi:non-heme chloroperoxidase